MTRSTETFEFDFDAFEVATAEMTGSETGMTLFRFPNPARAAVDVRGGSAALRESSVLEPGSAFPVIDALVFAGGSTYGLDAASGVMEAIHREREARTDFMSIPAVPAAIVYDYSGRADGVFPNAELGRLAFQKLTRNRIQVGGVGAGRNVSVGKVFGRDFAEPSGQGAAFVRWGTGRFFGLTVLNALGNILDLDGRIIAGNLNRNTGTRESVYDRTMAHQQSVPGVRGNTTVSVLITDMPLSHASLQRLAMMAHVAMGRVIEPFQTPYDGDALFCISTDTTSPQIELAGAEMGAVAGRVMQSAVLNAISAVRSRKTV